VIIMTKRYVATAAVAALILPLCACSGSITTDEVSYQIAEPVTALVVGARAAGVEITAGAGPIQVTEVHRYSDSKPDTTHRVEGRTLRLTEAGCGDDNIRCEVRYRIRMPGTVSTEITAQGGAVSVTGLAGNMRVTTEAGSVETKALTSDEVVVESSAGAASLEFADAPALVRATTELGAVTVRVPGDRAYAVTAGTKVGATEVSVRKDPASAHRIEIHTDVGAIQVEPLP
jgi:DUF4097 and DUF4098 domain-containing protein YvlB